MKPQGFIQKFQGDFQAWRSSMQIKISLFLILKQLGQRLFFFFLGKCGSHLDCLTSKYTTYVHCHHEDVYSNLKRVNVVFMLFSIIYLYWCPTWFQYQMMFLSYYRKTRSVTSIRETSYPHPRSTWVHPLFFAEFVLFKSFVQCFIYHSFSFCQFPLAMILSVFCQFPLAMIKSVFCQFPLAMILSVFCQFALAMILSVFLDVRLLVTSLISSNLSCTLAEIVICSLSVF